MVIKHIIKQFYRTVFIQQSSLTDAIVIFNSGVDNQNLVQNRQSPMADDLTRPAKTLRDLKFFTF